MMAKRRGKDQEMRKFDGKGLDMVAQNVAYLKGLFPEVFAEDKIRFDRLREVLGDYLVEEEDHYNFTWHGKRAAGRLAQTPGTGTLRPCRSESVDWDNTNNLFIEGDNLEVLKLLQKSYHRKVKMIYIDPPYNTGNDFIYKDDFKDGVTNYLQLTGQLDGAGKRMGTNSSSLGRYHTNWLNMIYPRLKLARNLLRDDGVIFISIDDNEQANLKKLCDEIFGEENFVAKFSWRTDGNFDNQAKIKRNHEYIACYCKDEELFPAPPVVDPSIPETSKLYKDEIRNTIVKNGPKNPVGDIKLPSGFPADFESGVIAKRSDSWPHYSNDAVIEGGKLKSSVIVRSGWSSKELVQSFIDAKCSPVSDLKGQETRFVITKTGAVEVIKKRGEYKSHVISSLSNLGGPQKASGELEELGVIFDDYPKPTALIKYLTKMVTGDDFYVLDFFAGSGTTAHSIVDLNQEERTSRKFILIQLPEQCREGSQAQKAGYKNIADIAKERLRRAAQKIKQDHPHYNGDLGFKLFKLDTSNIKRWDADFDTLEEDLLAAVDHIKQDRSEEDILYELLLKYGLDLATPILPRTIAGKTVHIIGMGALVVCLDKDMTLEVINGIGALKAELGPDIMRLVLRDDGFKDDVVKTNALQTLKRYDIEDIKSI